MEDNHCVIKDLCLGNQFIAKVPITSNCVFPSRITLNMKGKTNLGATFKEKSNEAYKHCDKEDKDIT